MNISKIDLDLILYSYTHKGVSGEQYHDIIYKIANKYNTNFNYIFIIQDRHRKKYNIEVNSI